MLLQLSSELPTMSSHAFEPGDRVDTPLGLAIVKAVDSVADSCNCKLASGEASTFALSDVELAESSAQEEALPQLEAWLPSDVLPMDPRVVHGNFSNGMVYYVMPNGEPRNRAELAVVIKSGSIHEDEHERGIAHMLEHLTFRASKHHQNSSNDDDDEKPEFDFVHSLEAEGLQFGAHQNAYTTFDETVYFLHVPLKGSSDSGGGGGGEGGKGGGGVGNEGDRQGEADCSDGGAMRGQGAHEGDGEGEGEGEDTGDNADGDGDEGASEGEGEEGTSSGVGYSSGGLLARCVGALASLVLNARLTDQDVEAERTIVVEEWRSRQGAAQRFSDAYFDALTRGTRYADRMPIGTLDVIRTVTGDTMRQFYAKRYHPQLMAVVAVGDFEGHEADVVHLLQSHFGARADNVHAAALGLHFQQGEAAGGAYETKTDDDHENNSAMTPASNIARGTASTPKGAPPPVAFQMPGTSSPLSLSCRPLPPEPQRKVEDALNRKATGLVVKDSEATYSQAIVAFTRPWPGPCALKLTTSSSEIQDSQSHSGSSSSSSSSSPNAAPNTVARSRAALLASITLACLNNRLRKLALDEAPPFTTASLEDSGPLVATPLSLLEAPQKKTAATTSSDDSEGGNGGTQTSDQQEMRAADEAEDDLAVLRRGARVVALSVSAPEGNLRSGLAAAWAEVRRAQAYGFGAKEFARVRASLLADLQSSWSERNQEESNSLAEALQQHFLQGEQLLAPELDIALDHSLLLSFTLPELQACLVQLCPPALTRGTTVLAFQPSSRLTATLQRCGCPHVIAAWIETLAKEWLRLPPALLGSTEPLGEALVEVGARDDASAGGGAEQELKVHETGGSTGHEAPKSGPTGITSTAANAAVVPAPNLLHLMRNAGASSAVAARGDGFVRFNGRSDENNEDDEDDYEDEDGEQAQSTEAVLLSTAHPRGWVPNPTVPGGWLRHRNNDGDEHGDALYADGSDDVVTGKSGISGGESDGSSSSGGGSNSSSSGSPSTSTLVDALSPSVPKHLSGGLGLVELVLGNGMKVVYKYNDFLDDEVLVSGYAPGGLTQALPLLEAAFPDNSSARSEASAGTAPGASVDPAVLKQRRSAMFALRHGTAIASLFGLYGLPLAEVEDALAGKRVSLQCDLGLYARSLSADCSPQDLATQLRMVHLAFTAQVQPDTARWQQCLTRLRDSVRAASNDPTAQFDATLAQLHSGDQPLFDAATLEDVNSLDVDLALEAHSLAFRDPSEWRFVVSGALDPRQLRALLDTHLASIPAPGQHGWPARTTAPSRLLLPDGGCGLSLCAPPLPSSTSLRTENQNENAQEAPTVELRKNQQQRELPAKSPFAVAVPSEVQPLPSVFLGGATSPVAKRLKIAMQDPLAMLSVAWPVALGPSSSSLAPAQQQQEQHAKLNPLFSSSSAGGGAAAGTTGSLSTNAAVEEEEFATSAVPSSAAAKIHAARLEDALLLEVACNILEQRLRDTLRLQMGAVYGVSVGPNFGHAPPLAPHKPFDFLRGRVEVHFSCAPETLPLLEQVVLDQMQQLRTEGPTPAEVVACVKAAATEREEAERTNSHWLSALHAAYNAPRFQGDVAATYSERAAAWRSLSSELLAGAAADSGKASPTTTTAAAAAVLSSSSPTSPSPPVGGVSCPATLRMQLFFAKLLPDSQGPAAICALQPAAPFWGASSSWLLPGSSFAASNDESTNKWQLAALAGAATVAGGLLLMHRARRASN